MDKLRLKIRECAAKLGMDPSLIGYTYFIHAVEICISTAQSFSLSNACEIIAQMYSCSRVAVQRALYYAIDSIDDVIEKLLNFFGVRVNPLDFHPKLLICAIANHVINESTVLD